MRIPPEHPWRAGNAGGGKSQEAATDLCARYSIEQDRPFYAAQLLDGTYVVNMQEPDNSTHYYTFLAGKQSAEHIPLGRRGD